MFVPLVLVQLLFVLLVALLKDFSLVLVHVLYVMQMQVDVLLLQLFQDVMLVIINLLLIHVLHVLLEQKLVHHLLLLHVKMDFSKDQVQFLVQVAELVHQPVYQQHRQLHVVEDIIYLALVHVLHAQP